MASWSVLILLLPVLECGCVGWFRSVEDSKKVINKLVSMHFFQNGYTSIHGDNLVIFTSTLLSRKKKAQNPHSPSNPVSPSPLTTPQFPPPLRSRVWVSSSTAPYHFIPISTTPSGPPTFTFGTSTASARHSLPTAPLPWSILWSPHAWIIATPFCLVSPTNSSINSSWSKTLLHVSSPKPLPSVT